LNPNPLRFHMTRQQQTSSAPRRFRVESCGIAE
jgi:hypothetical protein